MRALIFGASGGLAAALAHQLLANGWQLDLVSRLGKERQLHEHFAGACSEGRVRLNFVSEYAHFQAAESYDAHFMVQALFAPRALVHMDPARIDEEIAVGLTTQILLTRKLLAAHPAGADERRDFCFIGSTSAYAGFKNTSVYCAVKHGLLGFVRAMNDEYSSTNTRFWLFSMGTMNTEMGAALIEQDPSSFLQPEDVAQRIVAAVTSKTNMFEPEIVMRRRTILYRESK